MIIWGFRTPVRLLASFRTTCGRCGQVTAYRLVRTRRMFTLFFVPLLPLRTQHVLSCGACGAAWIIPAEQVGAYVAADDRGLTAASTPPAPPGAVTPRPLRRFATQNQVAVMAIITAVVVAAVLGVAVSRVTRSSTPQGTAARVIQRQPAGSQPPQSAAAAPSPAPTPTSSPTPVPILGQVLPSDIDLGLPHYAAMVADPAHSHVFVSPSSSASDLVVVVDYHTGRTAARLSGLAGATGMALSADGRTLYVALSSADAVAAVDTATLTVRSRWSTGGQTCPAWLALAGGRLWVGEGCDQWAGRLASLDPSHPQGGFIDSGIRPNTFYSAPLLASPAPGSSLLATGVIGLSPAEVDLWRVSGASVSRLASESDGSNLEDLTFSPDGDYLLQTSGAPYQISRYATPSLTAAGHFTTGPYAEDGVYTADGRWIIGAAGNGSGNGVDTFSPASPNPVRRRALDGIASHGVVATPDGLILVVTAQPQNQYPFLTVLRAPLG